ncbi:uncharacterized protein LOC116014887 [Ipomoea triloba]|uniref:uncharacterized protein LOC116014887 n=1 Tax=Ipomoea triloba TaxID=35885 RepID=UPI00125CF297|nr:uncharacterized protein LOC116014887 [Ipomoea triloba]
MGIPWKAWYRIPKKYGGLGFMDLRAFNLAMLGKQAWRFLTRPHSLVARIYKARDAHELEGSLVSRLIDPNSGTWDHSILLDIFSPTDVERILKVPVSLDYEDFWFWLGTRGCYLVKEGYKRTVGSFDIMPGTFDKWLHLWKIKSPVKWKTFLRRALSNVLPTTTNLIIKRVDVNPSCPMCGLMHENIMHSLLLCDFFKLVWHESSLQMSSVVGNDFSMWFTNALSVLTEEELLVAVAVLYHIWRARNTAEWEGSLPHPKGVWRRAQTAVVAWREVHMALPIDATSCSASPNSSCYCFERCRASCSRVATEVLLRRQLSTSHQEGHGGSGLALGGWSVPRSFQWSSPRLFLSTNGRVVGMQRGAIMAQGSWTRGLASVDVYTDCSNLKHLLTAVNTTLYSYVAFSVDASGALMSAFNHCFVNLVPRAANLGAHTLATSVYL